MKRRQKPKRIRSRTKRRLRKQPKMRRMEATAAAAPRLRVPKTAKRRKRRNSLGWKVPKIAVKRVFMSARWLSLGVLLLSVYALYLIGMDLNYYLTTIPVEGASTIPPAEIIEASGLAGSHVFGVNPSHAAAQVNEMPGVLAATVTLNWPNKAAIVIEEDSPIAIWHDNGEDFWVTETGALIPARVETVGLLRIESEIPPPTAATAVPTAADTETEEEEVTEPASPMTVDFVADDVLAGALQLRELRPNINKLYYRPSGGLSYQDGRGWRAYFGVGADMAQKLVVYETIVADVVARDLTPIYISVSNQEKPFYLASGGE